MKKAGIVILVLGILGLGVGVFGLISEQSARGTIEEKQALLSETVPELTDVADLNDVADLVSIERMLSGDPSHPPEVQSAATDILDAMGDEQDMVTVKLGGLAGGGVLALLGGLLFVLGRKRGREDAAAV